MGTARGRAQLLLIGWEGTLAPLTDEDDEAAEPACVQLWMEEARSFAAVLAAELARNGEALPLEQLAPSLRRRLQGVYALPVAAGIDRLSADERSGTERIARLVVNDWKASLTLFARRWAAGQERLAHWLGGSRFSEVVSLSATSSEVHDGGGATIAVGFVSGAVVFYKPRPVTGELLWAELQTRLREIETRVAVPAAEVLACDDDGAFGWMERLAAGRCDAALYWQRAGALLCAAAVAGLSDLHMANVIATDGGPAVADAECLGGGSATTTLTEELLATGLLPHRAGRMPDTSGFFGKPATVSGLQVPRWREGGRAVSFETARLVAQSNRPQEEGPPLARLPEMVDGYCLAAEALRKALPELLAVEGWGERLEAQHATRIVARSTLKYGLLMSRTLSPEVVGSDEARENVLRQGLMALDPPTCEGLSPSFVEEEVSALMRLAVPRFERAHGSLESERGAGSKLPERLRERVARFADVSSRGAVAEALATILFSDSPAPGLTK